MPYGLLLLFLCAPASAARDAAERFCRFQEVQWDLDQRNQGARRGAQAVRARLFHRIKDLAVAYLENDQENQIAARAAGFLKSSTVTVKVDDLSWMNHDSLSIAARYDEAENSITLTTDHPVFAAPSDAFLKAQVDKLKPRLAELAPTLVHEARHARDRRDLGALPSTPETELVAYTEETMYVWRRLLKDPGYLGLDKVDANLRSLLGYAPHVPWWSDAIDYGALGRALDSFRKLPRRRTGDPELVQYWVLLHSLAGGYEVFEGNLHEFGLLGGETLFAFPRHTLNYAASERRFLDLLNECARSTTRNGLSRELDILWNIHNEVRRRAEQSISYNQPYKNYFVQEIVKQKREVDSLISRP